MEGNEHHHGKVVKVLQDISELVTNDKMRDGARFDVVPTLFPFLKSIYISQTTISPCSKYTEYWNC